MTDEALDALDIMDDLQRLVDDEGDVLARASLRLITALRTQLAAANARADRAEAERAAQIEVDAGICDGMQNSTMYYEAHECASAIRAQPHDRTALDRMLAEAEARGIKRAESLLLGLLKGEYSSLTIGFNDDHARNYVKAEGWRDEYGFYTGDDKDLIAWVSDDEREKAIADNSVWTLQWYPRTPVGFECLGASSLSAILALIEKPDAT